MDLDFLISEINEHADDCRSEIHKAVATNRDQGIKIAVAFEVMLDRIEENIRDAFDTSNE